MYVIARAKKLKRCGEIYKEEVKETHYKRTKKVDITNKGIVIDYKINQNDIINTERCYMSMSEIVGISIFDD